MSRTARLLPFILLILLGVTLRAGTVTAQTCTQYTWGETPTQNFTFVYQKLTPLGADLAAQYSLQLDAEYDRFVALFQTTLPTPITVRLYPFGSDYACLNALAPVIPTGQTHSHLGAREIALISEYILADPNWPTDGFDALRHELALLFVQSLTGGKVPPGLEMGIGLYAEDPAQTFEHHLSAAPPPTAPSVTWRSLWEAPDVIASPETRLQAASLVAYLVDVYGWDKFVAFLSTLRTAESYRTALSDVYATDLGTLEDQWLKYYPLYFAGRWRENALYTFSLTAYEQLIAAGAYQAATEGLNQKIVLLTQRGDQPELLAQAQTLLATAATGLEADALARQAYQAYQEAAFPAAAEFAAQALEKYTVLHDIRNQDTLLTLQSRAEEILTLRLELDNLAADLTPVAAPRLLEVSPRLSELGDTEGVARAEQLLTQINVQRQQQAVTYALMGVGVGVALLVFRVVLSRRKTPPEVLVQY